MPDETYGEKVHGSEVSSEIPSSLPHCLDEVKSKCRTEQMRNVPEILVDGLDLDEFIGDDYTLDDNDIQLDKHQFKEYLEKPNRLRHSSYNYDIDENNDDDLNEFSIVRRNDEGAEAANVAAADETKSIDTNNPMQSRKSRKPNMFATSFGSGSIINNDTITGYHHAPENPCEYRPLIRITSTEDERVEHFLQEEQILNTHRNDGDILIKSKTTQMFECRRDECASDDDGNSSESQANSPSSITSLIDVTRRESMVSDVGSEPIQFGCKQLESPNYIYNREDSSTSNKSNTRFERSQSHFSELEYIQGRDDWKDDYARCSISGEIDSDNYHHLRRYSEAAETLEYIRGREDWLQWNGGYRNNRTSLSQIFEAGEPNHLIQDEIDSDEYHHNFFQHEAFYVTGELGAQPTKATNAVEAKRFEVQSMPENVDSRISSCNEISVAANSNAMPNTIMYDNGNKIDVVIDTIDNDTIEITVWDLTPESQKNNPFIFISDATADNQDSHNDDSNSKESNQSIDSLHCGSLESAILTEASSSSFSGNANSVSNRSDTHQNGKNSISNNNKEYSNLKIQCETSNRPQTLCDDSMNEQIGENQRKIRAKSEKINSKTGRLLNPEKQKPRRTLSSENVEDLIEQCSNGPWFHK